MADDTKFSQFSLLYAHICKQHTGAVRTTHLNTNGTCKLICLVKSTVGKYLKYCTKVRWLGSSFVLTSPPKLHNILVQYPVRIINSETNINKRRRVIRYDNQ
jgi:hypothetical protein